MFDESSILILIFLSAFFSGSETALFSLSRAQVRLVSKSGSTGYVVAKLLASPRRLLTTILVGNLIVNTALTSFLATYFIKLVGPKGLVVAIVITTILLLIFGEIFPKIIGMYRPQIFSKIVSFPLLIAVYILAPIRIIIRFFTNILLLILKQPISDNDPLMTKQAFELTLLAGKHQGGIEANEAEIIHAISSFYSTLAFEIMIPRPKMKCIEVSATIKDALDLLTNTPQYLLPVFDQSRDNIVAILNTKNLLQWHNKISFNLPMRELINLMNDFDDIKPCFTKPMFVPELKYIDSLLVEMNNAKCTIAILLDEHGGTSGLITKSIIINYILGGMINPYSGSSLIHVLSNGAVVASGDIRIKQLNWECNYHLPYDETTLAGYVLKLMGCIPKSGQEISDDNFNFKVLQMNNNQILAIRVTYKSEKKL